MRALVPLLSSRGTPCDADEADALRDEVQRLYKEASDLRLRALARDGGADA